MAVGTNAPVIIKRKKMVGGDGHHGGAWKVAYADFVTAMMAFFMLMWLLNATTEQQRKGIADYFAPTIPLARVSAGGDGALGGEDVFSRNMQIQSGTGGVGNSDGMPPNETDSLAEFAAMIAGQTGEALFAENELRHIVTSITDEGLVIDIFATPSEPIFVDRTAEPTPILLEILDSVGAAAQMVQNEISVHAHHATQPVVVRDHIVWDVSLARAGQVRQLLEAENIAPKRFVRAVGHADRDPAEFVPTSVRNNRIRIVFLRSDLR
ncbi:chemotaxis protein MotB [Marivivens niveibacter]|uniref:Chemotaxis protein MotB n=1 Tax=Marivivens niveibacter TaxID=1930667 RepID=A0A251WZL7_9RHOB|nr:flagellar motor protein MotB [Marivivens niveibacter]OUD09751.1 chemotaxis protein MotB [Marivivens niveibacter]